MPENDELPWPHCLGVFDEESCRYFLHDAGRRIVRSHPFSFGMEEVYTLIVERYGFADCADAIAIIQELLEDDQNAGGLGDDGDIWRSWRHSWRHRNDDRSNPFIPRVGNRILPAPTLSRMRRLKAKNYVDYQLASCIDTTVSDSADTINEALHRSQRYSAIPFVDHPNILDEDIQFTDLDAEVDRATDPLYAPNHSTRPFSKLQVSDSDLLALRGGDFQASGPTCKRVSLDSSGLFPVRTGITAKSRASVQRSRAGSSPLLGTLRCSETDCVFTVGAAEIQSGEKAHSGPVTAGSPRQNTSKCFPAHKHSNTRADVGVATENSQPETTTSPDHRRRTANRQARLVDGTIFTSCTKKFNTFAHTHTDITNFGPRGTVSGSSEPTASSLTKPKSTHRLSWLRGLRAIVRNETSASPNKAKQKHQSAPVPVRTVATNSSVMSPSSPAHSKNVLSPSRNKAYKPQAHFGLDGSNDDNSSSHSGVNLNKPLPLNPEDVVKSMSSRTSATSPAASLKLPSLTPSTISSTFSGASGKIETAGKYLETSDCAMLGPHELLPIIEDKKSDWMSFDPPKSSDPPSSPKSDIDFAIKNPWEDEQTPKSSFVAPQLRSHRTKFEKFDEIRKPRGLTLSQSEPKLQYATASSRQMFEPLPLRLEKHSKRQQGEVTEPRGREQQGMSSHSQKEDQPPKTPTKRSRSPVKRFLGLGKSDGPSAITVNKKLVTPKAPKTPTSNKSSVKKWGDRLRYGFLTADQDQMRQEELLEQHMSNIDTPPSQKSTFPVSLEPPHQAKAHSEMELIITVTANRYLLREAKAGRLSAESVSRLKDHWHSMGRPQVIEFHYDQLTQHNLIISNLNTVRLHGDAAKDPLQINSTLHGWKMMAKEMSIRTLCDPDSVIRKHLHDGHRVLELLGAPFVTFLAYDDMQVKTLARITARQKDRMARKGGSAHGRSCSDSSRKTSEAPRRNFSDGTQDFQYTAESFQMDKINLAPSPTPTPKLKPRKPTGAENAIMSLPLPMPMTRTRPHESHVADQYDESRGGRLGKIIREKPEDLLL